MRAPILENACIPNFKIKNIHMNRIRLFKKYWKFINCGYLYRLPDTGDKVHGTF